MKTGDVVILLSGGPRMTVTKYSDDATGQKVSVLWYAKANGRSQFCTADSLPAASFKVVAAEDDPEIKAWAPYAAPKDKA